jgi:hypothetical protein
LLTVDQVRARQKGGQLELVPLKGATRRRALELAASYVDLAERSVGQTREWFEGRCAEVPVGARDRKLAAGLRKLVEDRCTFDVGSEQDPADLRAVVFERAAAARRALEPGQHFDRQAVLEQVAQEQGTEAEQIERTMYADLRSEHVLLEFDSLSAERLVQQYELAQAQAVLLRAVRLTVDVNCSSPGTYRLLFRKLKFLRLLHTIERGEQGYRIEIDGPYSLFASSTKYGLQLALLLPTLRECDRWSLQADIRWGKERTPLDFHLEGTGDAARETDPSRDALLPEEVQGLLERFQSRKTPWRASPCDEILSLPGVGECVPDLVFEHRERAQRVYLEALGFWSREAVWRRVELVQAGLRWPIVFAVPRRLRVREEVLDEELPAALYVYKGAMSPKAVEDRLERALEAAGSA